LAIIYKLWYGWLYLLEELISAVWQVVVNMRALGHDAKRVDGRVALVVVILDVSHVYRLLHSTHLIDFSKVTIDVRVVTDKLEVGLEVNCKKKKGEGGSEITNKAAN